MAPTPRRYGSISEEGEEVELLPTGETFIGTIDAGGHVNDEPTTSTTTTRKWTRHNCISYTLAALLCFIGARYWHGRAEFYDDADSNNNVDNASVDHHNGVGVGVNSYRVPMPPALSKLNPKTDLGFRSTTRSGLALPSKAWGEHYLSEENFTPLPTNEWYLNLLSHKAASNPANAGEVAHVYTIPYVLGVSPPQAPKYGNSKTTTLETFAGIELFMPVLQASTKNMQMVFDKNNGVSLGAIVDDSSIIKKKETSAATSYIVDPNEDINPLGVSLKWNHVNIKSSIVRGMPYGTVRYGKDGKNKSVLPTILSGNRPVSILIDDSENAKDTTSSNKMMCGSTTGEPVVQNPQHKAPISQDGKAHTYSVQRELLLHFDDSDFTWIVFFSKPVQVQCYSDAMAAVSVPGGVPEVQFRLNVVAIDDEEIKNDDEELVVRLALLDECTTGKAIIKAHCEGLKSLGYETLSSKTKSKEYLKVLREGSMLYPKSPMVGIQFPEEDEDDEENGRVSNVMFDWDATSVNSENARVVSGTEKKAEASIVSGSFGLRGIHPEAALLDTPPKTQKEKDSLIMFALPHHLEYLSTNANDSKADDSLCLHSFHGRTCLVQGSQWNMPIDHGKPQSFIADRPPVADAIPAIAEALTKDIHFQMSSNILRGAADTYFPAKILAKMGRVIEINEELQNLKSGKVDTYEYSDADDTSIEEAVSAATDVTLPSDEEVNGLLDELEEAVSIWLNPGGKKKGGAEAEFLYDSTWGGFVNCGCKYTFKKGHEGEGSCNNTFPVCPALEDVNEDFGNGWYNDHHFHYGYHIYAAAIVAKHRPKWGIKYYDRILLYIRDIANPSAEDKDFPMWRQKDWYLGNSWAAGLMSMELSPHGREQESSSEAIAAFEGIALYGNVMMDIFAEEEEKLESARLVRNVGELLTAMELKAANQFWHVWGLNDEEVSTTASSGNSTLTQDDSNIDTSNSTKALHVNTYPAKYNKPAVGMMYDTMASFQTWFANVDVVSYGIQLIPLTAVAERRDDPEWSKLLYPLYAESCKAANKANDGFCEDNGWSIVQAAVLAETGEIDDALQMASEVPAKVMLSDGACGESLSNTLWFIATRKH